MSVTFQQKNDKNTCLKMGKLKKIDKSKYLFMGKLSMCGHRLDAPVQTIRILDSTNKEYPQKTF